MKPVEQAPQSASDTQRLVRSFIAKFEADQQILIRAIRRALRKRLPGAFELVYDNYNFFVIAYSPSERPAEIILSMAADAHGVTLFFLHGTELPDPRQILLGSGKQVRSVRVPSVTSLKRPEVEAIIAAAVARSRTPLVTGKTRTIIRLISPKQRPRRKPATEKAV